MVTLQTSGGLAYWFYDDVTSTKGSKFGGTSASSTRGRGGPACGRLLCAFTATGDGFVNFPSSEPRLGECAMCCPTESAPWK